MVYSEFQIQNPDEAFDKTVEETREIDQLDNAVPCNLNFLYYVTDRHTVSLPEGGEGGPVRGEHPRGAAGDAQVPHGPHPDAGPTQVLLPRHRGRRQAARAPHARHSLR